MAQAAPLQPPAANVSRSVLALLGLAPLAGNGPPAPPETAPMAWLALAALRRLQEQDLLHDAPNRVVHTIGTALVDNTQDALLTASSSSRDSAVNAPEAKTKPVQNIAISKNGVLVRQSGTASAFTDPGEKSRAVARGDGATADATDCTMCRAIATGDGSIATATGGAGNVATVSGVNSTATATGGTGNTATVAGGKSTAVANNGDGNTATVAGDNSFAAAGDGDNNTATVHGTGSGAFAFSGNDNTARVHGTDSGAFAYNGSTKTATVDGDSSFLTDGNGDTDSTAAMSARLASNSVNAAAVAPDSPTVVARIPVGSSPQDVAISPDGKYAYVTDQVDDTVTVIDTKTNKIVGTPISVGRDPYPIAVSPDGSKVYVGVLGENVVKVIDTQTGQLDGQPIALAVYDPRMLVVTADGKHVYVGTYTDGLGVIDTESRTSARVPITLPPDSQLVQIAISPNDPNRAYITTATGGPIQVLDTNTNTVIDTLPYNASAVAINDQGDHLYFVDATDVSRQNFGIFALDTNSLTTVGDPIVLDSPYPPTVIAVNPDDTRLYALMPAYATTSGNAEVRVIDRSTGQTIGTPAVLGFDAQDLAVTPDGLHAYVTTRGDMGPSVEVIGPASEQGGSPPDAGGLPPEVALALQNATNTFTNSFRSYFDNLNKPLPDKKLIRDATRIGAAPNSTAELYTRLRKNTDVTGADFDGIDIEKIRTKDKETAYIVYIGGTTLGPGYQSVIKNLPSYNGDLSGYQMGMIRQALADGGNPRAKIMLVGYSQGGMDAQNIAASHEFNVTTVVTFGSPIIRPAPTDHSYQIVHLEADLDPIPGLSKQGVKSLLFDRRPSNVNFMSLFFDPTGIGLHGNEATYVSVGEQFEKDKTRGYDDVKRSIRYFRGDVIR
ncbi:hypothetical protein A5662_17385 [Mycobacteriaceae bacterium 1482268.1]|nr:hypothetical protein A5662_17385 [Mycobacteriaceae bacterium 1482268.1]